SEHRVYADERIVLDHRGVLHAFVEIGSNAPRTDVDVLPHGRVAEVGEVRDLAPAADAGADDLGEAAYVDAGRASRAGAQLADGSTRSPRTRRLRAPAASASCTLSLIARAPSRSARSTT